MVYNEQCKFTSALITVNAQELKEEIKARGISIGSDKDMDAVINLLRDDIGCFVKNAEYSGIPPQWRPASFAIIPGIFDESNGLVNSTMKLVRYKVRDYYKDRIGEIYSSSSGDPLLPGNRAALKAVLGT
jgi:long-chain acyl-CoA synthetase